MTAQMSEEAGGAVVDDASPGDRRLVARRANQLCRRAEPHTDSIPCAAHLHEAQRQLFRLAV
jgi:hypothetical protein